MAASSTCTPSAISSAVTLGRSEHGADDAGVAMGERAHGVEDVRGVARTAMRWPPSLARRSRRYGRAKRRILQCEAAAIKIERAGQFRREREDARGALRGIAGIYRT